MKIMSNGRIFYFSEASSKSGFGQCARNISRGLGKAGFDVFLLGWGYRIDELLNMDGYKIVPFGDHPPSQNSPATLASIYQQFQPVDAIITQWDSLTGDRFVPIYEGTGTNGYISVVSLEKLYEKFKQYEINSNTIQLPEVQEGYPNILTLTHDGWKPIKYIGKRHVTPDEKIYLVKGTRGYTKCTAKHSLIDSNGKSFLPSEIKERQTLHVDKIHAPLQLVLNLGGYNFIFVEKQLKLAEFIGAYVSEGSLSKGKHGGYIIRIANKDINWIKELQNIVTDIFNIKTSIQGNDVFELVISSNKKLWNTLFEECGKGFENKRIPSCFLNALPEVKIKLFKSLLKGDGTKYKTTNYYKKWTELGKVEYTTKSEGLVADLSVLLATLGINFGIYQNQKRGDFRVFSRNHSQPAKVKQFFTPIKHNTFVYDIEVEGAHTFVDAMGLMVVHNTRMGIDWWKLVKRPCSWINYPVIDGYVWDLENTQTKWASNWVDFMKEADKTVAMSEFGAKILKASGIDATPIPHGVDTGFFIPLNEEQKKQIRQSAGIPEDAIVVGDVFKNMMRKLPDKFFQTLVMARKKNPKIVGLLHSSFNMGEFNLPLFAHDYGLTPGKDVFFSQTDLDYGKMPAVYNCMDMFYHPGGIGEGFGLPVVEAMSCGVPVVAPRATTMPEILDNGNAGVLFNIVKYPKTNVPVSFSSFNMIEFVLPDIFSGMEHILRLANDKQLRQDTGFKGRVRASTVYDWSSVLPQWCKVVKDVINPELPAEWASLLKVGDEEPKTEETQK
jgi:glycosyltransferase involved in cell wall biosynthesis